MLLLKAQLAQEDSALHVRYKMIGVHLVDIELLLLIKHYSS